MVQVFAALKRHAKNPALDFVLPFRANVSLFGNQGVALGLQCELRFQQEIQCAKLRNEASTSLGE